MILNRRKKRRESEIRNDPDGNLRVDDLTVEIDREPTDPSESDFAWNESHAFTTTIPEHHDARNPHENADDHLHDALAHMNIDRDFNNWNSFRKSLNNLNTNPSEDLSDSSNPEWQTNLLMYTPRWKDRDEVYSHRYRPTEDEDRELKGTQILLGLSDAAVQGKAPTWSGLMRAISGSAPTNTSSDDDNGTWHTRQAVSHLLQGTQPPYSIVLQRGPVVCDPYGESELVLLTHGLMLARIVSSPTAAAQQQQQKLRRGRSMLVRRRLAQAWMWNDIAHIAVRSPTELVIASTTTNDGTLSANDVVVLQWPHWQQQEVWRQALEKVYTEYALRSVSVEHRSALGWQYHWMQRPAFYVAVSKRAPVNQQAPHVWRDKNEVDIYQGYTPLHYAVRLHHTSAVQFLLQQAQVDPNAIDQDGHVPLYYAIHDQVDATIVQLLYQYGADKLSPQQESIYETGELFGRVAATEAQREQAQQAHAVQAEMAQNMRLLRERGEKIEQLGNKAGELNEGAQSFANMARKLKDKSHNKKWFQRSMVSRKTED
jgi:hypothetical protein